MAEKRKGIFEADRRMELRLRLALKNVGRAGLTGVQEPLPLIPPHRDLLDKLIEKVRAL